MPDLRVQFASGVSDGGAYASTLELAAMANEERAIAQVVFQRTGRFEPVVDLCTRAWVKAGRSGVAAGLARLPLGVLGAPVRTRSTSGVEAFETSHLPGGLRRHLIRQRPDVLVVNSVGLAPMQWIVSHARSLDVPVVLYIREEHALRHLSPDGPRFDGILANAHAWVAAAADRGHDAVFAPSVVRTPKVHTSRRTVLFVNPIAENRPQQFLAAADSMPDREFVLQESWPLPREERTALLRAARDRSNVTFRERVDDPAVLYGDAWVLWAPYSYGRPRVVLEAQANGIPVVGVAVPVMREAIGPGGIIVPADPTPDDLVDALTSCTDPGRYRELSRGALAHAARPEVDPRAIIQRVIDELRHVVVGRKPARP